MDSTVKPEALATRRRFLARTLVAAMGGGLFASTARAASGATDFLAAPATAKPAGSPCTRELQQAIDRCHDSGGGVVRLPPGRHVTGSLRLRRGVRLHLEAGSVLLGSTDPVDYPVQPIPRYRSLKDAGGFKALIYAEAEDGIGLSGEGIIDGQGAAFPLSHSDVDGRPRLLQFVSCRDVTVTGLHLRNSALWMQHYLDCEQVRLHGLRVWNHANRNNDAIDLDGCRFVTISDCLTDSGDDGITLKSTGPAPCEHVAITNCVVRSRCNAIKCGTESTGGFRNIAVSNCVVARSESPQAFNGTAEGISAIALEVVDGGVMDGVTVSNIVVEGTLAPLFIRLGNRARKHRADAPEPPVGTLRNVIVSNFMARGCGNIGCSITGLPGHRVEHVTLRDVRIELAEPGLAEDVGKAVEEFPAKYPEAKMWGRLPAHGFYVRHARNIRFRDVEVVPAAGEPRPMLVLDDVMESPSLTAPPAGGGQ